jgi:hypothetical protein
MTKPPAVPPAVSIIAGSGLVEVTLVSGEILRIQGVVEKRWFENTREKYLSETKFTENTDLQDLDRLLGLELLNFRWTQHLAAGIDYDGNLVDEEQLRRNIKDQAETINKIKVSMSLNKASRDDNSESIAAYLQNLREKAKLFGLHRENQLTVALTLMNEIIATVGTFLRSDDEERKKTGFDTEAHVLKWIDENVRPRFLAVDEHFEATSQKYWIRSI